MKGQVALASGFAKALRNAKPGEVKDAIKEMTEALEEVSEQAEDASIQNKKMGLAIQRAFREAQGPIAKAKVLFGEFSRQFPLAAAGVAGFADGLVQGFKFVVSTLQSALDITLKLGSAIFGIGKAIIAIPFKMLEGLVSMSNKLAEMMDAVRQATEDVRKAFGDITEGPGRAIIKMARDLQGTLTTTGLSGYKVFGNLAERMKFVQETAQGMGASFETFRHELEGRGGAAILLMQKGLGLTGEDMGAIQRQALATGKTFQSTFITMTKVSTDFGKRFDVSAKLISRDMAFMIKDAQHFGNMAPVELAKVSVYTKKLGIDVKDLLGVIDKFDTFEDAAVSAAKLGQAFGVNVDAIALMSAENPADRVQQLRDAFFAAGKSAEQLTRQELKLLAQTSGLSEEAARAAFSQKNMGVSMQDLDKQGKVSEKRQISQEEALVRLSDAIDRMVKSFGQFEGFLQAFTDGFARGVATQNDFMGAMVQLRLSLVKTKFAGIEVGRAFVEMFPGIKELVKVFRSFVDVSHEWTPFSTLLRDIVADFKEFFTTIGEDPEAIPNLFNNIRVSFENFLGSFDLTQASAEGNKFSKAMGNIVAGMLRVVADGLPKIIDVIIEFIKNPNIPSNVPGNKLANAFIDPIKKEFEKGGSVQKILDSLKELFDVVWEKAKPYVEDAMHKVAAFMLTVAFTKAIMSIAVTAISQAIGAKILSAFAAPAIEAAVASALGGAVEVGAASAAAGAGATTGIGASLAAVVFNPLVWIPAAVAAVAGAAVGVSRGMDKFKGELRKEFGETESMVGASIAGIVDTLSFGLVPESLSKKIGEFTASATKSLIGAMKSLPFGEELAKAWEDAVQTVIKTFKSLGDIIMSLFTGDGEKLSSSSKDLGANIVKWLKIGFVDFLPSVFKTIDGLLKAGFEALLLGVGWVFVEAIPATINLLTDLAGAILNIFAGIFYQIGEFLGEIPVVGGVLQGIFGFIGAMFETLGNGFIELRKSWSLFGKLFVEMVEGWWTTIKETFNSIVSTISTAFDKIVKMVTGLGESIKAGFKDAFGGIGNVISSVGEGSVNILKKVWGSNSPSTVGMEIGQSIVDGMTGPMKNLNPKLQSILDTSALIAKSKFGQTGESILELQKRINMLSGKKLLDEDGIFGPKTMNAIKLFKASEDKLIESAGGLRQVNKALEATAAKPASPALSAVKRIVDETNEVNKMLENLGPIDIDARLKEMAEKLGVNSREFTINRGDLKLHINLNVIMEADKVASAVIATKKVVKTGE